MSLLSDVIGEFLGQIFWDKMIRPILFYTGAGIRFICYFGKKKITEIRNMQYNSFIGFLFFALSTALFFLIKTRK